MTDHERAVIQQALGALECVDLQSLVPDYGSGHYSVACLDGPQVKSAITALRAALAQQAVSAAMYETDVQLVARLPEFHLLYVQDSQGTRFVEDQDTELQTELLPVVTYRAQVNAEGYPRLVSGPIAGDAQEPVGEMQLSGVIDGLVVPVVTADLPEGTKLYTAPPQRKPLSEEEIGRLCDEVSWSPRQLARAVERAHGIKE